MVAFLFNVDGLLCRTHEAQAEALHVSLSKTMLKKCPTITVPSQTSLLQLVDSGKTSQLATSISNLVPELGLEIRGVLADACKIYFALLSETNEAAAVVGTMTLLGALHDIGHIIGIVSTARLAEIFKYCTSFRHELLELAQDLKLPTEIGASSKSSTKLYLRAAKRLGVSSKDCIVFADSLTGVQAGKAAGMIVTGLQSTYTSKRELLDAGATEVVHNFLQSSHVISNAYSCQNGVTPIGKFSLEVRTVQGLSSEEQQAMVDQTYAVYNESLRGHTQQSWHNKLIDTRDYITRVGIVYEMKRGSVGYFVFKIREVEYQGATRFILLVSAGSSRASRDGALRGSKLLLQGIMREYRHILLSKPNFTIHTLDNFISFPGYRIGSSIVKNVRPSMTQPVVSEAELKYMQFLAASLGYRKAEVEDEHVWITSSQTKGHKGTGAPIISAAEQYFLSRVGDQAGHGLYCIAPVTFNSLWPMVPSHTPQVNNGGRSSSL